jgi:excisionase family DNA binding protein
MSQRISSDRVLLPTSEACKITGFSTAYIQRLLREKRLEGIKVGPLWLVYEDSLTAFLAQPRKRGPKGPHKKSPENHLDALADAEEAMTNGKGQEA